MQVNPSVVQQKSWISQFNREKYFFSDFWYPIGMQTEIVKEF